MYVSGLHSAILQLSFDIPHSIDGSKRLTYPEIESIPEGAVVFISCPPDIPNAVYGGLVATRSKVSKAAGTVVDGRIRDLQQMRNLKYPVSRRRHTAHVGEIMLLPLLLSFSST